MEKQRKESLEAVLQLCGNLGAEIRYHPEYRYFTAMVWTGWDTPCGMGEALAIQQEIQRTAAQYPTVVCYCFDPFSTPVSYTHLDVYKRQALRIYHQERWKQKMKFRQKWKPGGHPRCSPQPYHRYRKKRLLNKPCIGYEAEEECIYGKRSVLRSANSCQHRRSAA